MWSTYAFKVKEQVWSNQCYYIDQNVGLLERPYLKDGSSRNANVSIDAWAYLKRQNSKWRYKKWYRSSPSCRIWVKDERKWFKMIWICAKTGSTNMFNFPIQYVVFFLLYFSFYYLVGFSLFSLLLFVTIKPKTIR